MSDALTQAIENIRNDPNVVGYDEASVRQIVVLQILNALGWNTFARDEVTPEFGGGRVDYCLRIGGQSEVFIEAKRGGEDLADHQTQLVGYAKDSGVGLAALVNGLEWRFYLPLREGASEDRVFAAVNIATGADAASEVLLNVLSKDAVESGSAVKRAEGMLQRQIHARLMNETLPAAWKSLLSEPDDALVKLLANRVETISETVPSAAQVRNFLAAVAGGTGEASRGGQARPSGNIRNQNENRRTPTRNRRNRTANQRSRKEPTRGFRFLGEIRRASSWVENMQNFAEIMHERHPVEFARVAIQIRGRSIAYFSRSDARMRSSRPIGTSGWFAETHGNAQTMRNRCIQLATAFGYNESDIEFL